jgi:hypothetical protein
MIKQLCYGIAIVCFVIAGAFDILINKDYKTGLVAWLLATANAIIFFWK